MPLPLDPIKAEIAKARMSASHKGEKNHFFGKHHSEETKRKLSESRLGKHLSEDIKNKMSTSGKGRPKTEEHKRKIGQSQLGKSISESTKLKQSISAKTRPQISEETRQRMSEATRLENHPLWKGGISFLPYCQKFNTEFKERVRSFFGHKCVECGKQTTYKLHVHHVNYDKETCCNDSVPMFVTLCRSCHAKTQKNRSQWEQHFASMITNLYEGKCYIPKGVEI